MLVRLIRDNKYLIKYGEYINRYAKDCYEKGMNIIVKSLSLTGIISMKETRHLFYKSFNNPQICDLMEAVINYKTNIRFNKYLDAWKNLEEVFQILNLDAFDINWYFSYNDPVLNYAAGKSNLEKNYTNNQTPNNNCSNLEAEEVKNLSFSCVSSNKNLSDSYIKKKGSGRESIRVKERKVLLENINKSSSKDNKEATVSSLNSDNSSGLITSKIDLDEEKIEQAQTNSSLILSETISVTPANDNKNTQEINNVDVTNTIDLNEKTVVLHLLIKKLISFESLKLLKCTKSDIKFTIDEHQSNQINSLYNDEINSKLHELLKQNLLNELFQNIINKIFSPFYETIGTNPLFTSRLENILLYYYNIKNKISNNSLLDLEKYFYTNQHNLIHKGSVSMNDIDKSMNINGNFIDISSKKMLNMSYNSTVVDIKDLKDNFNYLSASVPILHSSSYSNSK